MSTEIQRVYSITSKKKTLIKEKKTFKNKQTIKKYKKYKNITYVFAVVILTYLEK